VQAGQADWDGQLGDELLSRGGRADPPAPGRWHRDCWALLAARHASPKELLDEDPTVVRAGEPLAREAVVVSERTAARSN